MSKLKACPYCHSKAVQMEDEFVQYVYIAEQPDDNHPFHLYHLHCDNCGVSGDEKRTKKAAAEAFYKTGKD
jgi:hypothetical protein